MKRTYLPLVSFVLVALIGPAAAQEMGLSQDEARHQAYCRHSEIERADDIVQLQASTDPRAPVDLDYIRQNCPPSDAATQQHNAEAERDLAIRRSKFVFVLSIYQANGEFTSNSVGLIFDSAAECDRYAASRMKSAASNYSVTALGNSVLMPNDDTGYLWFGCVSLADSNSAAFARFVDVKMTPERARSMKRFPKL